MDRGAAQTMIVGTPMVFDRDQIGTVLRHPVPITEMTLRMDRTVGDVAGQMRELGLAAPRVRQPDRARLYESH